MPNFGANLLWKVPCAISGFLRDVDDICALSDITQRRAAILYRYFGTSGLVFKGQEVQEGRRPLDT
jgi:hypothetical protein